MSKIENLKPFEKGKSGNPTGRPKGSKNRSTIIREMLDMMVQVKDNQGNDVWQSNEYRMVKAIISKAIEKQAAVKLGLAISIKWNEQAQTGQVQIDCQSLDQMTLIFDKLGISDEL